MRVDLEQLLELLGTRAAEGAVWVIDESGRTSVIDPPSPGELDGLQRPDAWPMYLIRADMAENYVKDHGLGGALVWLNRIFALSREPRPPATGFTSLWRRLGAP